MISNENNPIVLSTVTDELQARLDKCFNFTVFSGSGLSTASGILPFRGLKKEPYFERLPPSYICGLRYFIQQPAQVWRYIRSLQLKVAQAQPNPAHCAIARWQKEAARRYVVTANIFTFNFDRLLSKAGCDPVAELHGDINRAICISCNQTCALESVSDQEVPHCSSCGDLLKPDVVFIEDLICEKAYDNAIRATRGSSMVFFIGISGILNHSNSLVFHVKARKDVLLIEINSRPSYLSQHMNYILRAPAEEILPQFRYGSTHQ